MRVIAILMVRRLPARGRFPRVYRRRTPPRSAPLPQHNAVNPVGFWADPARFRGRPSELTALCWRRSSAAGAGVDRRLDVAVEAVGRVDGAGGLVEIGLAQHDRDADLTRGDHLDVDAVAAERVEQRERDARVGAHARADDRELADLVVVHDLLEAEFLLLGLQLLRDVGALLLRQRERDVGAAGARRL